MNIVERFKASGKSQSLDFLNELSKTSWPQHALCDACVYAAQNNHSDLFNWAHRRVEEPLRLQIDRKCLEMASHRGHDFVFNVVSPKAFAVGLKKLFSNAASKGHENFISGLIAQCGLSPEHRIAVLISATRNGHLQMVKKYVPATPNPLVFEEMFLAAAQKGQQDVLEWLENIPNTESLMKDEKYFLKWLREAVANAHPNVVQHLLTSEKWEAARQPQSLSFEAQMVANLNMLLRVSQDSDKKHAVLQMLLPYVSFEKWQKSHRYLDPFKNEYMFSIFAAHQKKVLQEAVLQEAVQTHASSSSRRKM